jgi:DNA sulfur modification protein DndD
MELAQLQLKNFRQFRNESIDFAQGNDRNVTVIHGSNGAGKTTLLNAFTWLLYGRVNFDTRPNRIANEGAMYQADVGDDISVQVDLRFEHNETLYHATRESVYRKMSKNDLDGQSQNSEIILKKQINNSWKSIKNPRNTLDQLVPERLSGLFFFDGEDIDELAGIDNQERIQEAIQNIMGLTILERAVRHFDVVAGRFEDEVQEFASDELSALIDEKREIKAEIEDLERKQEDTERARDRLDDEIKEIDRKLRALPDSAELQTDREEYQQRRANLEDEISGINESLSDQLGKDGFIPIATPLISETAEDLDELRKEGLIPSELNDSYIDDLLEAKSCLCNRPLKPGSKHYDAVERLKGEGVADGVEGSALRIINHIDEFTQRRQEFFTDTEELIRRRSEKKSEIQSLDEKIDEISSRLKSSSESVGDLQRAKEKKQTKRDSRIEELGAIADQLSSLKEEKKSIEEEIDSMRDEREKAKLAKRRQVAAERVGAKLQKSFEQLKNKVRQMSNERVNDKFSEIATKDMTARINSDFELEITQTVGQEEIEVDKSTGERQIASLAFIGSLVSIARDRYESDSESDYFSGGIYPLVMDSPFGALDKSHRREVSRVIPTLANQVVVFATDSQWEGPVEEEMSRRASKQYWLDFDPGDGRNSHPQTRIQAKEANITNN